MALFKHRKRQDRHVRTACPLCHGEWVALGVIDHLERTVRHCCLDCGYRWRDGEVDLVSAELAARAQQGSRRRH